MATRNRSSWMPRPGFLALLALAALWLAACGSTPPKIVVEPAAQDLGELPQQPLELSYTVRNQGGSPLQIEKISTSCGCTEAAVDQETIPVDESTQLRVTLDPTEDDLYGNLVRIIYIRSNDPDTPEAEAEFRVTIRRSEG
ncbi:MAG: DUF1573 domain-containing protein [Anaerolineae bacterium]